MAGESFKVSWVGGFAVVSWPHPGIADRRYHRPMAGRQSFHALTRPELTRPELVGPLRSAEAVLAATGDPVGDAAGVVTG